MFADDYAAENEFAAEEELLQWASEPAPVSPRLRSCVLAAARTKLRRRRARREMQWVAAGLLTWATITYARTVPNPVQEIVRAALAPFQNDGNRVSSPNLFCVRGSGNGGAVDLRALDDLVWKQDALRPGLTTWHRLHAGNRHEVTG